MAQKNNRPRRSADEEQPVLQLTSHQLTYAVVGLIASFCILFILGILTGRMSDHGGPGQGAALGPRAEANGEGKQTTPRTGMLETGTADDPINEFAAPSEPVDERRGAERRGGEETPEPAEPVTPVVTQPDPPWEARRPQGAESEGNGKSAAEMPEESPAAPEAEPVDDEPPLAAVEEADTESVPATEKDAAEDSPPLTVVMSESELENALTDSVPPPPPIIRKGKFTVQVASFTAENRERAEAFVRELAATEKVEATMIPSEDGKWCRIVVGHYADRKSATEAWNDLKKRPKFKGCFIKGLN
jgi:septal ring-binding cell division protein DamX